MMKHDIKGYIGESNDIIYYTNGTNVFRASKNNVVDVDTGYLIGRWECSLDHFKRFRSVVYPFLNNPCSDCGSKNRGFTTFCADCGADT